LLLAVSSGLVIPIDDNCEYRFATTSVREAAYSLIPSNEREAFHLTLARKLWRAFTEEELNEHHSVLLGQLKLGVNKMTNLHERTATATLCLHAAQEAVKWAMFPSAAENLDFGLGLLCDQSWNTDYELTLALHNMAAEVGYVLGDFSKVQERVEAVLVNAHILDHTFQAYGVRLNILSATGKAQEAIDMGLHILNQIGEVIPPNPKPLYVQREYIRSRRLMKSKSSEMIRRLPSMTNHRKAAAMQIINLIVLPSLMGRPNLLPVLATRATRITVEHGLCNLSSLAFAIYGMVLTGAGEIHEAIRYGELALELLECFGVKQWLPRVYVCVYGCIFGWTKNLSSCIENLDRAFDVGVETGDVEVSMHISASHNNHYYTT
jgi:predicted ATPase